MAKRATDRRPSALGIPNRAELTLRMSLPRALVERLTAQAIRQERGLEALVQELLENSQ